MNYSDLDLIKSLQGGDQQAFESLVERYQRPLFNFVFKYLRDYHTSEDIAQEAFLNIYRTAPKFEPRPGIRVSTWIFKIAYNLSLNEIKRCKRYRIFQDELNLSYNEENTSSCQELKDEMNEALAILPENQRAALMLRVNEEFSYKEISEILNISVSATESLIFRARTRLREYFQKIKTSEVSKTSEV